MKDDRRKFEEFLSSRGTARNISSPPRPTSQAGGPGVFDSIPVAGSLSSSMWRRHVARPQEHASTLGPRRLTMRLHEEGKSGRTVIRSLVESPHGDTLCHFPHR